MKTKFIYMVSILLLGLSTHAQGQSEPSSFNGIQSSLNEFMARAAETHESLKQNYDQVLRIAWLTADIRMMMNARFEKDGVFLLNMDDDRGPAVGAWTSERDGSLYAEFDWQNMAESMRVKSSESQSTVAMFGLGEFTKTNPAQDFNMYIDAQNYWYVPSEEHGYLRVDLIGGMQNVARMLEVGIEAAIDAQVTEILDRLGFLITFNIGSSAPDEFKEEVWKIIPKEVFAEYLDQFNPEYDAKTGWFNDSKNVTENKLKPVLKDLAKFTYGRISMFPAFIHFAYIISPTLIRSEFDVQEESISFLGQVLTTKMTIVSGEDAGYQIIFDRYGRLIHLIDTDSNTATYWYDKDVSVTIPPATAIDMSNFKKLKLN